MKKVILPFLYNKQSVIVETAMFEIADAYLDVLKWVEKKEPHRIDEFFDYMIFKWKQFERLYRIQNR